MKKILPSILSADFTELSKEIRDVEKGGADLLHVDIMDGHFVPNITIGPSMVSQIKNVTVLPLDVHLMIEEPEKYISRFVDAGSNFITIHVEIKSNIDKIITLIKNAGVKAGITLKPETPVRALIPYIARVDLVLIMSVNPGFGGQNFMPESLDRIRELKSLCSSKKISPIIEVDGGVNAENIKDLDLAGVNYFVAGSTIFGSKDRADIIARLKKILNE